MFNGVSLLFIVFSSYRIKIAQKGNIQPMVRPKRILLRPDGFNTTSSNNFVYTLRHPSLLTDRSANRGRQDSHVLRYLHHNWIHFRKPRANDILNLKHNRK